MKRKIVLIVSLGCGLLAAVLTRFYIVAKDGEVEAQKQALLNRYGSMEVLCFAKDLPGGTVLSRGDLGTKTAPALGLRGQALTMENYADILGRKILIGHAKGEVLFWSDIEGGDQRAKGLSADIKMKMRAISIGVNGTAGVSGMVKPNDHVDVIGTFSFPQADGTIRKGDVVSCTILQNVLVLACGRETAKNRAAGQLSGAGYAMVTLQVTPREAEMLAFAEQMKGRLSLTLRNPNDTSFERELPEVDFEKIKSEIVELNTLRQKNGGR